MTRREKRAWLQRCRDAAFLQRDLELELQAMQAEIQRLTPLLTGIPGGHSTDRLPRAVERLETARARLADQTQRCQTLREQAAAVIGTLSDVRLQRVLRRRYLSCQSWTRIAEEMHIDERWAYRLHNQALDCLPEELP